MPSPPGVRARAAAPPPQPQAAHPQRERPLQRLDRACCGCWSCAVWTPLMPGRHGPPALPAGEGLVVHPAGRSPTSTLFIVPCDAAPHPPGHDLGQRPEADVGDPLADLDVAGAHRGRRPGVDDRARAGRPPCTGRSAPPLAGSVGIERGPQRRRPTALTVTASTALTLPGRCGSVPVKSKVISSPATVTATAIVDGVLLLGPRPEGVEHVGEPPGAVGQRGQRRPHAPLAVVEHLVERASAGQRGQPLDADRVGAHLGVEVAGPLVGRARVGQRTAPAPRRSAAPAGAAALLGDLGGVGRHRARRGAADVGVVGPVGHPADQPPVRRRHGATTVMSLRWVPPANGSFRMTWLARARRPSPNAVDGRRAPRPASSPRWTGMCSAWASSSPSAVNSAAEQSARSLMLGLNAARRSTAPISSATPVEPRRSRTAATPGRGSRRQLVSTPVQHERAGGAGLGPPARRAPRSCSRARRSPPARPPACAIGRRQVGRIATGDGTPGRGPHGHHLDRVRRAGRSRCAAGARPRNVGDRGAPAARGSGPRSGSRRDVSTTTSARPHADAEPARGQRPRPGAAGPGRAWSSGVGPGLAPGRRWRGAARMPDGREHPGPGRHDHRRHARAPRPARRRAAARRRRRPPAPALADRRPARPTRARTACVHGRVDHRDHAVGGDAGRRRARRRAASTSSAPEARAARRRRGCGRPPGRRR